MTEQPFEEPDDSEEAAPSTPSPASNLHAYDPGDLDRPGAFELIAEPREGGREDVQIFTPLSPVTVEPEPVKLPQDQSLER